MSINKILGITPIFGLIYDTRANTELKNDFDSKTQILVVPSISNFHYFYNSYVFISGAKSLAPNATKNIAFNHSNGTKLFYKNENNYFELELIFENWGKSILLSKGFEGGGPVAEIDLAFVKWKFFKKVIESILMIMFLSVLIHFTLKRYSNFKFFSIIQLVLLIPLIFLTTFYFIFELNYFLRLIIF